MQILALAGAAVALAAVSLAAGYWLHADTPSAPGAPTAAAPAMAQQPPAPRKPLYYQDPDGKPDYSPTPKKTADGRDFKPVYGDSAAPAPASAPPEPAAKSKILYYRHPMGLADTSPVPKKDSMGMDYIAVYEGDDASGVVSVSPARVQMLGVKTAPVELRASLSRSIRATGAIQPDESRLAVVTTKFDVVVEKLLVATTGAPVRAGQPLARVWIQTPDIVTQMGPDVITRQIDYIVALQDKNPATIAQTENVLRQYGIPASAIAEIHRTHRATRSVTITAPRSGVIIDKPAIEGMRFNTGDPLFKIADVSSVWLMADVQEQDLGQIRIGETAQVAFVAFPGRSFAGTVDFIYPSLMANTRAGRVRIVLSNPDGLLRESMYATVAIDAPATSGGSVLVVPDSAVIDSGAQQVVLVVKGEGRYEPRAIRIGARGDGFAQVLGGLKPGEQVVVSANFLIDAESNLRAALQSFALGAKKTNTQPAGNTP
ncbi:MAG: efflux RND transporter periplasmic adaptor subunit [Proteobacteria bacterium]|nr:efflux RND transporter periplasmic adaptor subunit [Pseudomonadota bacterium]